jgi:hypothetical protein
LVGVVLVVAVEVLEWVERWWWRRRRGSRRMRGNLGWRRRRRTQKVRVRIACR